MPWMLDKVTIFPPKPLQTAFAALPALFAGGLAAAVSLGVAGVSLFKAAVFLCVLVLMVHRLAKGGTTMGGKPLTDWVPVACAGAYTGICASALWSSADSDALTSGVVKYGKLLLPVLLLICLTSVLSVKRALALFFLVQAASMLGTWAIAAAGRPDWLGAMPRVNGPSQAPSLWVGYLDQAIMNATVFGMTWHLRNSFVHAWAKPALLATAALAAATTFLLPGRTGHLMVLALLGLTVLWALPPRLKVLAVLAPVVFISLVFFLSSKTQQRAQLVVTELQSFRALGKTDTSTGERLHYWSHAVRLVAEHPIMGTGLASWNTEYRRIADPNSAPAHARDVRNPHQEYLMWAVQMGAIGVAVLLAWFASFWRDALRFERAEQRALQCTVAAVMVACLFNSVLWDALIGDFLCVALGLCWVLGVRTRQEHNASPNAAGQVA